MKRLIIGIGLIILSVAYFAEPAAAQTADDLAGSWALTIEPPPEFAGRGGGGGGGRGGGGGGLFSADQTLMFSVEVGALAGTHEAGGTSTDLTDITIRGSEVSFTLARQTQRGAFETVFEGELDGDTMTGTFSVGQGQFTINWSATR